MQVIKRIKLDFARSLHPVIVYAKQGDANSRVIEIEPLENGVPFAIPAGATARFEAKKPDGHQIYNDDPTILDNVITVVLSEQTLAAAGEAICTVSLYQGDAILTAQNFILQIEESPLVGAQVESSDDYQSFRAALGLVSATEEDEGKFLSIKDGKPEWVALSDDVLDEILPEQEITAHPLSELQTATVYPVEAEVVDGEYYAIMWDGVEYICRCYVNPNISGTQFTDAYCLGNWSIISSAEEDTGEPFWALGAELGLSFFANADATGTHTVSITRANTPAIELDTTLTEEGKAADAKAVGDAIAEVWDAIGGEEAPAETTILEETTFALTDGLYETDSAPFALTAGNVYRVVFDGAEYTCVATELSSDTGEPFVICGNYLAVLRGDPTLLDVPFLLMTAEIDTGTAGGIQAIDGLTANHTVAIYQDNSKQAVLAPTLFDGFALNSAFGCYMKIVAPAPYTFVEGKEYVIEWDGVRYTRTAYAYTYTDGSECVVVGNPSLLVEGGEDPFAVIHDTTNDYLCYASTEEATSHGVCIYTDAVATPAPSLPSVTTADNGKILQVVDGAWAAVAVADSAVATFVDDYINEALGGDY